MNEYIKQGQDFLKKTKTTCEIVLAEEQTAPIWAEGGEHGLKYIITLSNDNGKYTFDFWDSIANSEAIKLLPEAKKRGSHCSEHMQLERLFDGKRINLITPAWEKKIKDSFKPSEYAVLACLSLLFEDNFEDFCDSYGYDRDSIKGFKTFEAVKEQDRNMRKLFNHEELELLEAIA